MLLPGKTPKARPGQDCFFRVIARLSVMDRSGCFRRPLQFLNNYVLKKGGFHGWNMLLWRLCSAISIG